MLQKNVPLSIVIPCQPGKQPKKEHAESRKLKTNQEPLTADFTWSRCSFYVYHCLYFYFFS